MLNWLNENREWLFSGGGVIILGWLGTRIFKKPEKDNNVQHIKSGKNSHNYQSGRDINISEKSDNYER